MVGYLESYLHGGTTTAITASEVHVPGRPKDPAGVKALALAARACFLDYRPGGMRVHAGSIILEPGLTEADLEELVAAGLWLAKAGFGAFDTPFDYAPLMQAARRLGMITTMHTGGSSIPGSSGIWAEHVLASNPSVSFHVNGGPIAMPEAGFARLVNESDIALQLCTAGNLRTALLTAKLLDEAGQPERLLIATDTPTGSGIMPLGMFYTISHLASLGGMPPEQAIAAATGNNARVYRLNSGLLQVGQGCRRGADRRLRRRLAGRCALSAAQRRRPRGCRGDHRRHPALRRPQPQHPGCDPQRPRRRKPPAARFLRFGALDRSQFRHAPQQLTNELIAQEAELAALMSKAISFHFAD